MMRYVFLLLFAASFGTILAQNKTTPCSSPECRQFDFWLGDWDATYNDTVHASNHITREMKGCVTHEHFNDPSHSYKGESWSMYSPTKKMWQQTWVDDQGSYIALTGNFADGKMTLTTAPQAKPDGTTIQNRMVYYNITKQSFDWDWEATTDGGKTWKNNWRIHYKRKK